MQSSWTSDFIRQSTAGSSRGASISYWAGELVDALAAVKDDHEIHILGMSRIPRMPNYLIGSSSEAGVREKPLLVSVTEKTAELFLAPVEPGVRFLRAEFPLLVRYDLADSDRRIDLSFYEAICFDDERTSIILGLTLTETELPEFLLPEEIAELLPAIRAHAIPILELEQNRFHIARVEEEMNAMTRLIRESNPEIAKLPGFGQLPPISSDNSIWEPSFLQYIARELRAAHQDLMNLAATATEMSRTSLGSPQMFDVAQRITAATQAEFGLIRSFQNLAALSSRDVKPRRGVFPLQSLLRELYPMAVELAGPYKVAVELDERTRNIYVSGDIETLRGMFERLFLATFENCRGGKIWIRSDNRGDVAPEGMVMVEVRDNGPVNEEVPSYRLLDRHALAQVDHPRLKRGGGLLFQVLELFMTKSGGKLSLRYHMDGGLSVQFMLPLVSRAELDRIRTGEVG